MDLQGVQYKRGDFVVKSAAIVDEKGRKRGDFTFRPPVPFEQLSLDMQRHVRFTERKCNVLEWDEGIYPYVAAGRLIAESLTSSTLIVKGHQKKTWLEQALSSTITIRDVNDLSCASKAAMNNAMSLYRSCK